jgi:hypothetical protein
MIDILNRIFSTSNPSHCFSQRLFPTCHFLSLIQALYKHLSPTQELTLPSQYAWAVIREPHVMLRVRFILGGDGQAELPELAQRHTPSDVGHGCP